MKIYSYIEKQILKLLTTIWKCFIYIHEIKNIMKKHNIYKKTKLTKEEKKQITKFYKENYGRKIPYYWHRLYQSYTGRFDHTYVPEYIFTTQLELLSNKRIEILPLENKIMLETLFYDKEKDVIIPKTYITKTNGIYLNEEKQIISEEKAIELINEKYKISVIKISKDTNSGKGVKILNIKNGIDQKTQMTTHEIVKKMGSNFVIQEKIQPHNDLKKLYPNAVNTLRIITYICNNNIYTAPIVLRIGQGGNDLDNAHAGGMFIGVDNNGDLLSTAFTEYLKTYKKHPDTNIIFENYKIPFISKIRKKAIDMHKKIPQLKFISWDFTINDQDQIVLIEANMHSQTIWFPQMAHGKSIFEENTSEMLKEINKRSK